MTLTTMATIKPIGKPLLIRRRADPETRRLEASPLDTHDPLARTEQVGTDEQRTDVDAGAHQRPRRRPVRTREVDEAEHGARDRQQEDRRIGKAPDWRGLEEGRGGSKDQVRRPWREHQPHRARRRQQELAERTPSRHQVRWLDDLGQAPRIPSVGELQPALSEIQRRKAKRRPCEHHQRAAREREERCDTTVEPDHREQST